MLSGCTAPDRVVEASDALVDLAFAMLPERGTALLHPAATARAKDYGEGGWLAQKHAIRSRRQRHKLHLGVDADMHEIVAVELTR
jgi:hypothetical protein